jgi:hypothetical protein
LPRRIALVVLCCIAAGALAQPSRWGAGDRRDGKHIAGLPCEGHPVEMRGSRRDREAVSQRLDSAVWLHPASDRPLCYTDAARSAQPLRSVTTLPSYHLATHLSL